MSDPLVHMIHVAILCYQQTGASKVPLEWV
jgi:hypothetical protein